MKSLAAVFELKDMIFFCELQWLYRLAVENVPEGDYMLPLSEAEVK